MEMWNLVLELDAGKDDAAGELGDQLIESFGDYHPVVTVSNLGRAELILSCPADSMGQALATCRALARDLAATRIIVESSDDFDRRREAEIPPLLSVTEVAEALGLTRAAVQQRIDKGLLPAQRVGSTWVIPAAAIAAAA